MWLCVCRKLVFFFDMTDDYTCGSTFGTLSSGENRIAIPVWSPFANARQAWFHSPEKFNAVGINHRLKHSAPINLVPLASTQPLILSCSADLFGK